MSEGAVFQCCRCGLYYVREMIAEKQPDPADDLAGVGEGTMICKNCFIIDRQHEARRVRLDAEREAVTGVFRELMDRHLSKYRYDSQAEAPANPLPMKPDPVLSELSLFVPRHLLFEFMGIAEPQPTCDKPIVVDAKPE